ncbi:hypothetical protein TYRP_009433 [Tyrophagus putrescentiae]|nr:hypothetical protein TYRP_009433 [Tyrophagus putrescentiae]
MLTRNSSSLLLLYDNNGYMHTSGVHSLSFVLTHTGGNISQLNPRVVFESSSQDKSANSNAASSQSTLT